MHLELVREFFIEMDDEIGSALKLEKMNDKLLDVQPKDAQITLSHQLRLECI